MMISLCGVFLLLETNPGTHSSTKTDQRIFSKSDLKPIFKTFRGSSKSHQCAQFAVGFWGSVQAGNQTAAAWRNYLLNSPRHPPVDTFWNGPGDILFDASNPTGPSRSVMTKELQQWFGTSLRQIKAEVRKESALEYKLKEGHIPPSFNVYSEQGAFWKQQSAVQTLAALSNLVALENMIENYAKQHCQLPYTHVLLTQLDVLPYFYPALPLTSPNTTLFNEGQGLQPHSIERNYGSAGLIDAQFRYNTSGPEFNDKLIWIPWSNFKKINQFVSKAFFHWQHNNFVPDLRTSLYYLLKESTPEMLPYDMLPYSVVQGSEEARFQSNPTPWLQATQILVQANGWTDKPSSIKKISRA
jgi:hypothetical protein